MFVQGLVIGGKLLTTVQCPGGKLGAVGIVEVLDGDIRGKVAGDLIVPFVVKVVDVFQVLLSIDGTPPDKFIFLRDSIHNVY